MAAVEIRGLVKDFPVHAGLKETLRHPFRRRRRTVLKQVDLVVEPGEVVGVLGANGAGKTTLLKVIATILRPTAGSVRVNGYDVDADEDLARAAVGYTFTDDRSFYWRLTGRQNLEFFAALEDLHGPRMREAVRHIADRLDIAGYLDQPFRFYSTGIRQRFALARALIHRPSILLLDEPTRSVDSTEARSIWALIREEINGREGAAAVLVTHRVEEAIAVCDRIAILHEGRLKADVTPSDLHRAAEGLHGVVITLDGFQPAELSRLRRVPGVTAAVLKEGNGEEYIEVHCLNSEVILSDLVAATTAAGARIRSLAQTAPVEDVLTRLVEGEEVVVG